MSTQERDDATRKHHIESAVGRKDDEEPLRTLWPLGTGRLQPELVDSALGTQAKCLSHESFGDGFQWEVSSTPGVAVRLQLFPRCRIAKLHIPDGAGEYEAREYTVHKVLARRCNGESILTLLCQRGHRTTMVSLSQTGDLDELHRFPESPSPSTYEALTQEARLGGAQRADLAKDSYRVGEAAEILGCTPSYLQTLAREGRIPAVKVGRDWLLDGEHVRAHRLLGRGPRSASAPPS